MDRDQLRERVIVVHRRILGEKAEDALEQARTARETSDRTRRMLRDMPPPPIRGG